MNNINPDVFKYTYGKLFLKTDMCGYYTCSVVMVTQRQTNGIDQILLLPTLLDPKRAQ